MCNDTPNLKNNNILYLLKCHAENNNKTNKEIIWLKLKSRRQNLTPDVITKV